MPAGASVPANPAAARPTFADAHVPANPAVARPTFADAHVPANPAVARPKLRRRARPRKSGAGSSVGRCVCLRRAVIRAGGADRGYPSTDKPALSSMNSMALRISSSVRCAKPPFGGIAPLPFVTD